MALGYCTLASVPDPIVRSGAATAGMGATTVAQVKVVWSDGTSDTYAPSTTVLSIYDHSATIDATALTWLVIAAHGTANLWWLKEQDARGPAGSLVAAVGGGAYAWLYRADGAMFYHIPQI